MIDNIKKFNNLFSQILKIYFNYATLLQDNIIRSIGNIYQILETIEVITESLDKI